MPTISIRIKGKLLDLLEQHAQKHNENISVTLRRFIEHGMAVADCGELNGKAAKNAAPLKQIEEEYKKSFEFMMLETAALVRLIIKDSGKFEPEDATRILNKAHSKIETYMQRYEEKLAAQSKPAQA